jgi:hypothetical protein
MGTPAAMAAAGISLKLCAPGYNGILPFICCAKTAALANAEANIAPRNILLMSISCDYELLGNELDRAKMVSHSPPNFFCKSS